MSPLAIHSQSDQDEQKIWRRIPGYGNKQFDTLNSSDLGHTVEYLEKYLDEDAGLNEFRQYVVSDHVLQKWGKLFDIAKPSSQRTCCFTRGNQLSFNAVCPQLTLNNHYLGYTRLVERAGSVLQLNEALDVRICIPYSEAWNNH